MTASDPYVLICRLINTIHNPCRYYAILTAELRDAILKNALCKIFNQAIMRIWMSGQSRGSRISAARDCYLIAIGWRERDLGFTSHNV